MSYRGKVTNGVVVLEHAALPEGTAVEVQPIGKRPAKRRKAPLTLSEKLLRWAGRGQGLPPDLACNHDHYLHGRPRK